MLPITHDILKTISNFRAVGQNAKLANGVTREDAFIGARSFESLMAGAETFDVSQITTVIRDMDIPATVLAFNNSEFNLPFDTCVFVDESLAEAEGMVYAATVMKGNLAGIKRGLEIAGRHELPWAKEFTEEVSDDIYVCALVIAMTDKFVDGRPQWDPTAAIIPAYIDITVGRAFGKSYLKYLPSITPWAPQDVHDTAKTANDSVVNWMVKNIFQLAFNSSYFISLNDVQIEKVEETPDPSVRFKPKHAWKHKPRSYNVVKLLPKLEARIVHDLGGTHASPRTHERRGHWREYKSGKRRWINAMIVNPGKTPILPHHYEVH